MTFDRAWILGTVLSLTTAACSYESSTPATEPDRDEPAAAGSAGSAESAQPTASAAEVVDAAEPVVEAEAPAPPTGYAVVQNGALLFDSSTGNSGFELPRLSPEKSAPAGLTVHVVGQKDDRLEIETLSQHPPENHCAGSLPGLRDVRLRMYVSRDDLFPVITKTTSKDFSDGTSIKFKPGVPVPPGIGLIVAAGVPVEVTVPTESTGLMFDPETPFSAETTEDPLYGSDPLTYDGGKILATGNLYRKSHLSRFATTPEGTDRARVTLRNECLEVNALTTLAHATATSPVAPPAIGEPMPAGLIGSEVGSTGGIGLVGAGGGTRVEYEVKTGTAIRWSDGRPAGQVTADHTFTDEPLNESGNSCFDVALTEFPAPTVRLCFAPGDLSKNEVSPPVAALGGLGTVAGSGTIGFGGTISKGSSGSGFGIVGKGSGKGGGKGSGSTGKRVPKIRMSKATVTGSLDKDIIRRIVRAHINEVRYCYNQGLARDPALKGKVNIKFVISPTGKVSSADVKSTTLSDANVGKCAAKAVKRWKFPKPTGGGVVLVTYPFVFSPS